MTIKAQTETSDSPRYPREATAKERQWMARLQRTLDAMPDTLQGFHAPGTIAFFDRDDECLDADASVDRAAGEIGYVNIRWIDAGDW